MYKKFLWIMAIVFSFTLSQSTFAHTWACGEGMRKMVESLKLEPDQKEKIKPILDQLKTSIKTAASQMDALEAQMNQQVDAATMDQSTVDGLIDQKAKLIGDMMKAKAAAKNQILAVLTPEQKMKLQGMLKDAADKMAAKFKECHDDD